MNISSDEIKNLGADEKYSKSSKSSKLKDFNVIAGKYIKKWQIYISNIKELISKFIEDNKDKYNQNFDDIIKKAESLFTNFINDIKNSYNSQYENILRAYEHKIRQLYENRFNLEINRKILEESNKNLLRKEKDFELMKEKTGIIVKNGKIINNSRKENEIFILRKENSILKDIIENQKKNLQKIKKDSKEHSKSKSNKRLFIKMNNLSLKNKNNIKNLYNLISPLAKNNKKVYRSYPRSKYRYKSDFISNLNYKLKAPYKSLLNYQKSKSCQNDLIKTIFSSGKKNKNISKFNNNYVNIKVQTNNNKIIKLSPKNAIKKKLIPKINEKNNKSLKKNKVFQQFLPRNFKKRYKSSHPSTLGISMTNTHRDNSKEYNSYSKKKNNSECLNDKKINLLNSSMIKSVKSQIKNKSKKGLKYMNDISPTYGNLANLIPKLKNLLNLRLRKSKFSNSFTLKNNRNNLKFLNIIENQNKNNNIKRVVYTKKEHSKGKKYNIIRNKKNKNIPDKKQNIRKIKSSYNSKGKSINNINNLNIIRKNQLKNIVKSSS